MPAFFYNNATLDKKWNTLANWWFDDAFTIPAAVLPDGDEVFITEPVQWHPEDGPFPLALGDLTVSGNGWIGAFASNLFGGTLPAVNAISFSGFTGTAMDDVSSYFLGGRYTTLDAATGNGYFESSYYVGGVGTSLDVSGNGWNTYDSLYYIGGISTAGALDQYGNGIYGGVYYTSYPTLADGWQLAPASIGGYDYYFAGVASGLNNLGNGFYDGHAYYNGALQPNGWNGIHYYLSDAQTDLNSGGNGIYGGVYYTSYPTLADGWQWIESIGGYDYYFAGMGTGGGLDSSGNGFYDGHAYYNGALQPTGWNGVHYYIADVVAGGFDSGGYGLYSGIYYGGYPTLANGNYPWQVTVALDNGKFYLEGAETTLETSGSGIYLGLVYSGGVLFPTGYIYTYDGTAGYYIDNVRTALDYSGNGTWETRNYFGGVSAGQPGIDTRWLRWNGNSWGGYWYDTNSWTLYSNADWSGNYATAGAGPTSVDNCLIPDYTMPVAQLNFSAQCNNITVQYNGNYWGFSRVYGGPLIVNGTATITGTNTFPMSGTGTANFTGSGKNIENITFGAINFRDSSYNTVNTGWTNSYGVCNVASFYDNATNAGGTYGTGLDIYAGYVTNQYGYYCGVVTGASSFYNNSINYGGCLGVATFYDNAKNMLGLNGGVILSYNKGINGTGILGIF